MIALRSDLPIEVPADPPPLPQDAAAAVALFLLGIVDRQDQDADLHSAHRRGEPDGPPPESRWDLDEADPDD